MCIRWNVWRINDIVALDSPQTNMFTNFFVVLHIASIYANAWTNRPTKTKIMQSLRHSFKIDTIFTSVVRVDEIRFMCAMFTASSVICNIVSISSYRQSWNERYYCLRLTRKLSGRTQKRQGHFKHNIYQIIFDRSTMNATRTRQSTISILGWRWSESAKLKANQ